MAQLAALSSAGNGPGSSRHQKNPPLSNGADFADALSAVQYPQMPAKTVRPCAIADLRQSVPPVAPEDDGASGVDNGKSPPRPMGRAGNLPLAIQRLPVARCAPLAKTPAGPAPRREQVCSQEKNSSPKSCENTLNIDTPPMGGCFPIAPEAPADDAGTACSEGTIKAPDATGKPGRDVDASAEDTPIADDPQSAQPAANAPASISNRIRSPSLPGNGTGAKPDFGTVPRLQDAKPVPGPDAILPTPAAGSGRQFQQDVPATAGSVVAMSSGSSSIGAAESNRAIALRIGRAIRSGEESLTVDLHPAELGHISVRLAFQPDGVEVRMQVSRHETFQAFNQDRASLEQEFRQAGIDLGSGGLDLRFARTPQPEQLQSTGGPVTIADENTPELKARSVVLADGLLNIVA